MCKWPISLHLFSSGSCWRTGSCGSVPHRPNRSGSAWQRMQYFCVIVKPALNGTPNWWGTSRTLTLTSIRTFSRTTCSSWIRLCLLKTAWNALSASLKQWTAERANWWPSAECIWWMTWNWLDWNTCGGYVVNVEACCFWWLGQSGFIFYFLVLLIFYSSFYSSK